MARIYWRSAHRASTPRLTVLRLRRRLLGLPMTLTLDGTSTALSTTNNTTAPIFNHANRNEFHFRSAQKRRQRRRGSQCRQKWNGFMVYRQCYEQCRRGVHRRGHSEFWYLGDYCAGGSSIGTGTLTLNGGELRSSSGAWTSAAGGLTNAVQINGNVTITVSMDPTMWGQHSFFRHWTSTGTPGNGPVVTLAQSDDNSGHVWL